MKILASLTIRTVAGLVVLLAWLSLVLDMSQYLSLELMSSMGKAALVAKLASTFQFPVLTHLSLVLSLVVFDEKTSFFGVSEVLLLGLHIDLKVSIIITTVSRGSAGSRDEPIEFGTVTTDRVSITVIIVGAVSQVFRCVGSCGKIAVACRRFN